MHGIFAPLPVLLKMSSEASILIVLVLAAQWVLGRSLKPRWRYALWLLVLLRLALPWTIPSPASLFNVLKMPAAAPPAQLAAAPVRAMDLSISNAGGAVSSRPSSGTRWLAWLWAMGALFLASCAGISQYKFHRRVGRGRALIDGPTLRVLRDCQALMGVSTPVRLIETEAVKSPTLFGFVRPRLLLPAGLASTFTREELRHVFLHELAHLKHLDILIGWVTLGLQIIHWFNPLVWLAFHRLRADRELACDALALSRAPTGENEAYGLTLVKLLEGFGPSAGAPSLAGILADKHQMKERILMIAKFHKTDRGLTLAVVLLAGLALATLTDAQNQTPPQPSKSGEPGAPKVVWSASADYAEIDPNKQQATYLGHVCVDAPRMKLGSERLTVELLPSGERVMYLTAETNVVIDFTGERGETKHLTGDRLVYAYSVQNGMTNGTMTVSGHSKISSKLR
jgi:beta-lactamase regulating signal transducer with metallopeptidase domain